MQIFPFMFAAASSQPAQQGLTESTSTGGSSFANLLGGLSSGSGDKSGDQSGGSFFSLTAGFDASSDGEADGNNADAQLDLLRKAFKKLGMNAENAETVAAGLDILPAEQRADVMALARIAVHGDNARPMPLSNEDAQSMVSILQKLGFQGDTAWKMAEDVQNGRGRDVWRQIEHRIDTMSETQQVTVRPSELLALRHALGLSPQAQARVGQALAGGAKSALSTEDIKKMLSLMEAESLRDDATLQNKVDSMKQIMEDALREARARQTIERNADVRQDKQSQQSQLKIEHAVKERTEAGEKAEFVPGRDMAKAQQEASKGERLADLRGADNGSRAAAARAATARAAEGNREAVAAETVARAAEGSRTVSATAEQAKGVTVTMREHPVAAMHDHAAARNPRREAAALATRAMAEMNSAAAPVQTDGSATRVSAVAVAAKGDPLNAATPASAVRADTQAAVHAAVRDVPRAQQNTPQQHTPMQEGNTPVAAQSRQVVEDASGQRAGAADLLKGQTPQGSERAENAEHPSRTAGDDARHREMHLERLTGRDGAGNRQESDNAAGRQSQGNTGQESGRQDTSNGPRMQTEIFSSVMNRNEQMSDVAKAAMQTERPHAVSDQVLRQIENGALRNLGQGTRQLTLRLDPPTLGKVSVILTVVNKEVKAVLKAENAEAGRVINDNLHQIRASMEAQGLRVEKLEVQTQTQNDPNARDNQWQNADEHNSAREKRENAQDSGLRRSFFTSREEPEPEMARHVQDETPEERITNNRLNVIA